MEGFEGMYRYTEPRAAVNFIFIVLRFQAKHNTIIASKKLDPLQNINVLKYRKKK